MENTERSTTVLIAGGGPVGLGLAIELGQRGIDCCVVERHTSPSPIPKGQNLSQRTMEHFHFWGAEQQLRAARTIPPDYGIGGLTTYGTLISDYAYDWLQREVVRPYYYTDNERLPQYATENALRERVAQIPDVHVDYGWTLTELNQDASGVYTTATNAQSGQALSITADYLVGCDGSRSVTRDQSGISQTQSDHHKLMVLLVFRSASLHELLKRYPGKSFYNVLNPEQQGYWRFFGRVDLGSTWFFHAPVPESTTRDNFDFNALLIESVGSDFDIEIEHIGFWDLRIATADTYRAGRVFIAGDAAHSHPPYGAFGINTGFEDARNLGWKLAAVCQGWCGEAILATYGEERRPVFVSTATEFIEDVISSDAEFLAQFNPAHDKPAFESAWQNRASGTGNQVNSFEPNYRGSSIVCGPEGASCNAQGPHSLAARAGHHLAPQELSDGANIYTRLGDGFTLLAFDADASLVEKIRKHARQYSIPLAVVTNSLDDSTMQYGSNLVLVRPDQFVAWASSEHDYSDDLLLKVTGR